MNINETLSELTALPVVDRLKVVESLWNSIGTDVPVSPSPEQQKEIRRRVEAHDASPGHTITWDQVLDQLRNDE